jgi:predicted RNase H-like HicB family nuclease
MLYNNIQVDYTQIKDTQFMRALKKAGEPARKETRAKARPPRAHEEVIKVGNGSYQCLIRNEPGSGYTVTCAELAPTPVFGKTLAEARANAREEISLWLNTLEEADRRSQPSDGSEPASDD